MDSRRNTIQRQLILNAVKKLNIHATAEQVYDYVVIEHPSISKATVYRNLSQMVESHELLNIGSFHGAAHYDHNCHKHYHFICDSCKKIFDVDNYLPGIYGQLTAMDDFEIRGHNLNFNGLCRDCKTENS
ncbi:MAG: transcriptional repressor [Treponema sp.]|nr:transcriptional repressor [Treponema sp.]